MSLNTAGTEMEAGGISAQEPACFCVRVVTMSGSMTEVFGLKSTDTLDMLRAKALFELCLPIDGQFAFCLGAQRFLHNQGSESLSALGIAADSEIACIRESACHIHDGTELRVTGAGTDAFNGVYYTMGRSHGGKRTFHHKGNPRLKINWCPEISAEISVGNVIKWPAGWYFQNHRKGAYFQCSYLHDKMPLVGWDTYTGALAAPGLEPGPTIGVLSAIGVLSPRCSHRRGGINATTATRKGALSN